MLCVYIRICPSKGGPGVTYDLHIHSCLSPCADDDMTPASIAGFAKLAGIDLIAVTDHNSAQNLPAAQAACAAYGVRLLPGLELNTAEEVHLLCYFARLQDALEMGRQVYEALPDIPCDPAIWGAQLVVDEDDRVRAQPPKLLTAACALSLAEAKALCESLGGLAVPAHVDRDSFSILSQLGFVPGELAFEAFELRRPEHTLAPLLESGRLPAGAEILTSSDAHTLADIPDHPRLLREDSVIRRLLRGQ